MRTAVILTAYNRPKLVVDAIESVLEQNDTDCRLYIMDDGCNSETRYAIGRALDSYAVVYLHPEEYILSAATANKSRYEGVRVVWYKGRNRTMAERKSSISYSWLINLCLNHFMHPDDRYICYLCDDDYLAPGSIRFRADYLDDNDVVDVVYGKLKSIQYDESGQHNKWEHNVSPTAGRGIWLHPDGRREFDDERGSGRTYFADGKLDPVTGLSYAEEGYWDPDGPLYYGRPFKTDHNQVMHRRRILAEVERISGWYGMTGRRIQYWPEEIAYGVGDAGFFEKLATEYPFYPVNCWAVVKRYHAKSDGVSFAEVRE